MVAYSFKTQFVDAIRSGRKRQTIRTERTGRSRHARPGEALQLYTAMRTKHCRLIGRATCTHTLHVWIDFEASQIGAGGIIVADEENMDEFARLDGFDCWEAMRGFWQAEHGTLERFAGIIIYWKDFAPAA